ncbi:MAG: 4Fe-4S ferredoxin [Desulfuromonadales bacterium]|nr:4Fe-4S ferredoxin [Desulfuromonadales bacterium]
MQDRCGKEWIEEVIADFCATPVNSLENGTGEPAWGAPQVGYARGDDPLFATIKADIGPFLWTPAEAFSLAFADQRVAPAELAVIVYLLPQTAATRRDQRAATLVPAERWARSRFHGEAFNCALRLHLAEQLTAAGFPAVAPERLPGFGYRQSARFGLASNWSERHIAWIAGLGTFGLSDGLITRAGKAVRFGSVVARIDLEPTPRPYAGHQDWCLWYAEGSCGACMQRCPAEAIAATGHDKPACHTYIREVTTPYVQQHYGTGTTPCGLCQVKIPCEAGIPKGGAGAG